MYKRDLRYFCQLYSLDEYILSSFFGVPVELVNEWFLRGFPLHVARPFVCLVHQIVMRDQSVFDYFTHQAYINSLVDGSDITLY